MAEDWSGLDPLRLVECRAPLRPVELPTGRVVPVVPFDAAAYALERDARAGGPTAQAAALALVRRCVPEATDEELTALVSDDARNIFRLARGQIDAVLAEQERRAGKAPAAPIGLTALREVSEPSPRTTRSGWWSRAWRRRSAATSGPSTPSRTT